MDTKFTFITLFCNKNTCVKYKQFPYMCVKYIYVVNGMQTIILTFKDVLKIHSKLIFIQYIFMFTNLFSLQYKEDHLVKFKTLSQLSPLLLHVSYYNFGIFWKVSTFD